MDKKVINALFKYAAGKDDIRPALVGVHFEKNRCYATDGHVLCIYNKGGDDRFAGKTIAENGETIECVYPKVDSVFPSDKDEHQNDEIDAVQLQKACQWQIHQLTSNENDVVVINDVGYNIRLLNRLLTIIESVEHQPKLKFEIYGTLRPVVVKSKDMKSIIMPAKYVSDSIDLKRGAIGEVMIYSYENFINDYVFNSWKKPETKKALDWLDK